MYLKTLEIHGFKSFADKTVLEFAEGVTGIVGPNGCGKSNVVDAIRWVLGETSAKALRGGEMADVIFNGTEKRKPLGMAEVTLTMADCEGPLKVDFNEVAITRRVFRDGKSEYRINGTLCRLKDIHDMLMDTGIGRTAYSIMAQGQIDQILSSKPEERRAVFEEAAGITKFKREKKEALRKLEYTEANLLRVSDVLAEQERRMNSLRRQVAKARRYQALAADTRVLDTHLGHRKFVELTAERDELLTSIRGLEVRDTELERMLPAKEEAVTEARAAARTFEGELAELRPSSTSTATRSIPPKAAWHSTRSARPNSNPASARTTRTSPATREKLAQQEFDFIAANESLDQLNRLIAEKELSSPSRKPAPGTREERERIETALRETRGEANRCQTIIATSRRKSRARSPSSKAPANAPANSPMRNNASISNSRSSAPNNPASPAKSRPPAAARRARGNLPKRRTLLSAHPRRSRCGPHRRDRVEQGARPARRPFPSGPPARRKRRGF
jgi:chromosome segregation protein